MTRTIERQGLPVEHPRGEHGQTMVEYGLLVSLISVAVAVLLGVSGFGDALGAYYITIQTTIAAIL